MQYFLYGIKDLPIDLNRNTLKLTLAFIHNTGRFVCGHFYLCHTYGAKYWTKWVILFGGGMQWFVLAVLRFGCGTC